MNILEMQHKVLLRNYTTIKVGGLAEFLAEPSNIKDLIYLVNWAKKNDLKYRIIGAGSNLLINDQSLKGLTICTKKLKEIRADSQTGLIHAECGVMLPTMANTLVKNCCKGGSWTIGIPGTIGGAIFMNAGSGNCSISEHLISVNVIDTENLKVFTIYKKDLNFKYRFSSFQMNNLVILSANFQFEPNGIMQSISKETKENLKRKIDSQPYHLPSFGSVFKNPDNKFAGKLIEDCGLKGYKIGGAQVSTMHANFIVNNKNASSAHICELISLIQQKVQQKTGIFLHPEVRMIGFDYPN